MVYTLTYSNVHESERDIIGMRALYLGKVFDKNVNSCLFFVVTGDSFKDFFSHNSLFDKISELSDLNEDEFWNELKLIFARCSFSDKVKDEIRESYDALSVSDSAANTILRSFDARVNVFVSSKRDVDLEDVFLNIKGFDNLLGAIKSCWFSFLKRHSVDDLKHRRVELVGVIVEKFVASSFSVEVEVSKNSNLNVFVYKGLPEISKGIVKDSYVLSFNHLEFLNYELNYQNVSILHQEESGVLLKKRLGREGADDKASKSLVSECARLAKRIFNTLDEVSLKVFFVVKNDVPYLFLIESFLKKDEEFEVPVKDMFLDKDKLDIVDEHGPLDAGALSDDSLYENDVQGKNAYMSESDNFSEDENFEKEENEDFSEESNVDEVFSDSDEFIIQGDEPISTVKENDVLSSFFNLVELLEEYLHKSYIDSFGFEPDNFEDAVVELESKHGFDEKEDILRVLEIKSNIMRGEEVKSEVISSLIERINEFLKRSSK